MEAQAPERFGSLDEFCESLQPSVATAAIAAYQGYSQIKLLACELAVSVYLDPRDREDLRYRGFKGLLFIEAAKHCTGKLLTNDVRRSLISGYATRGPIPEITLGRVCGHSYLECVFRLLEAALRIPVDYLNAAHDHFIGPTAQHALRLTSGDNVDGWAQLREELDKLDEHAELTYWSCVGRDLDRLVEGRAREAVREAIWSGGVDDVMAAVKRECETFTAKHARTVVDGIGREIAYANIPVKTFDPSAPFVAAPQDLAILDALAKEPCAVALEDIAAATGCGRKFVGERVKYLKEANLVASPPGMVKLTGITPAGIEVVGRWKGR